MAAAAASPVPVLRIAAECGRSRARAGELRLPHGDVPCPVFMPVGTRGTAKGLTAAQLAALGCRICLGNTFHLGTRPVSGTGGLRGGLSRSPSSAFSPLSPQGAELVRRSGGLHGFMDWPHNLLTVSGEPPNLGRGDTAAPPAPQIWDGGVLVASPGVSQRGFGVPQDSGGFQMVSLLELSEVSEEGVRFQPPHGGEPILLSPERSMEIQNALGEPRGIGGDRGEPPLTPPVPPQAPIS